MPRDSSAYDPEFEELWKMYPRHDCSKAGAYKSWGAAIKKLSTDKLLQAVIRYARSVTGKEERFLPHMSTWLNQGRWRDDVDETKTCLPAVKRSARYVLEREVFADQRFRVPRFLQYIMPVVRDLNLRGADDATLATVVGSLLRTMEDEAKQMKLRGAEPAGDVVQVLWSYLVWLREQQWPDATTAVLKMDSNAFQRFRGVTAGQDAAGRDPITGRSRYI